MPGSTLERLSGPRERAWTSHLAFALYREISRSPGNLLFSPYGLLGALMVLRAGAAGETRREIEAVVRRREAGEALARSFGVLQRNVGHLARAGSGLVELSTANALWCQSGCPMRRAFVETLRAHFGAEAGEVDFAGAPADASRTVNAWTAEATHGRVPSLLDGREAPALRHGMLTNLAFFTGPWLAPFSEESTWPEPFDRAPGGPVDVPMLHAVGTHQYARVGDLQVLHLPYAVSRIRMILLLPDEGRLQTAEADLDSELLRQAIRSVEPRLLHLVLPRCRIESTVRLRAALESLGILSAFGPEADFSRISESRGPFLDDVLHRSFVEVDEYGTEAVASGGEPSGSEREKAHAAVAEFRADRPFLFLICDIETETIFFMGRVTDPGR